MTDEFGDIDLVSDCHNCVSCKGAAYLMKPLFAIGQLDAPIVVVAQNPGSFGEAEFLDFRKSWNEESDPNQMVANGYKDFAGTRADKEFAKVFGNGWLESGMFCYTNAVRCRTHNNATPSTEMTSKCWTWTKTLLGLAPRKLVVLSGGIARLQVTRNAMQNGEVKKLTGTQTYVATIYHYSAWNNFSVIKFRELFYRSNAIAGTGYVPNYD